MEVEFYIKFHLCKKVDKFKWIRMAVYGPAQDDFKSALLAEHVMVCQENPLPTLIGGDFNIYCTKVAKRTMISLMIGGPSCSMLLSTVLILGR